MLAAKIASAIQADAFTTSMIRERVAAGLEVVTGGLLVSMGFWGPILDNIITGAHAVASVGGAGLAVHGVYRIIKKRRYRRQDDHRGE